VRHAGTTATRAGRFPTPADALTAGGWTAAGAGAGGLRQWLAGQEARALRSPALRAEQTARALGLDAGVEARLGPLDLGRWTGRALAEVAGKEPAALSAWRTDPDEAGHGGESLSRLLARSRDLLAAWARDLTARPGAVVAVTHGAVLRALVIAALGLPPLGLWHLESAPAAGTALHLRPDGGWTLAVLNLPLAALAPESA
jgi:broad specificity phosphatase PhoE